MILERFTEQARRVVVLATEEALSVTLFLLGARLPFGEENVSFIANSKWQIRI